MSDTPQNPYVVVKNQEDQFALWQADLPIPAGWTVQFGPAGREPCLAEIEQVWTDMTPRSVRTATPA
jgi:uncharacterized protein YbdZ (MbtH family)